jgi:lysine 2,3-aminomutase
MGMDDLRTSLGTALSLEMNVRGSVAGFNTPTFIVDAPLGGGKRPVHTYDHYDRVTGVSVYSAPAVKPGRRFFYFDPLDLLPEEGRRRWADRAEHERMVEEAVAASDAGQRDVYR